MADSLSAHDHGQTGKAAGHDGSQSHSHQGKLGALMAEREQRRGGEARAFLDEQLREAEAATAVGAFVFDLASGEWAWSAPLPALFGFTSETTPADFDAWLQVVSVDDVLKIRHAMDAARGDGSFSVEFRVKREDGTLYWLAGKGRVADGNFLRAAFYDINERKQLEARLLSVNETLEARVSELRDEARALEVLNRTGTAVGAELDLEVLVQMVTDAGVELSGAQFGAFFYNVMRPDGEAYTLYTLSGAPREAFAGYPMPRNTEVFEPTFRGTGTVRSADILADPRYGHLEPYRGMPPGHLPVRSYLAVPVVSRNGEVLGGLFFGHRQPGIFTALAERILVGLAAQAAVAIDNARLYQISQREVTARKDAEARLQELMSELVHASRLTTMGQLLASIAHEIKQPLTAVVTNANAGVRWLDRDPVDLNEVRNTLLRAGADGARAGEIIDSIRAMTKKSEPKFAMLDIKALIEELLGLVRGELQKYAVAAAIDFSSKNREVYGDRLQLQQVLLNVIMNAIESMVSVSDRPRVLEISGQLAEPNYMLVNVEDTGSGIDSKVADRIFDPFQTTKPNGMGIGLSICRSIVEAHGGRIWASPRAPHGATVCFTLPTTTGGQLGS
jgi:signal transduction histidine kinase